MQRDQRIASRFITPHSLAVALAITLASILTMSAMIVVVALRHEDDPLFWLFALSALLFYALVRFRGAGFTRMMFRASLMAIPLTVSNVVTGLLFGGRFVIAVESGSAPMPIWASGCLGTLFLTGMGLIGLATAIICAFASWIGVRSR